MKKIFILLLVLTATIYAGEEVVQPQSLPEILNIWIEESLGKLLALIGFMGTFVIYMMTHRASVLINGIISSLVLGGAFQVIVMNRITFPFEIFSEIIAIVLILFFTNVFFIKIKEDKIKKLKSIDYQEIY